MPLCKDSGYLNGCRYLLHDRDRKFCHEFGETLAATGVKRTQTRQEVQTSLPHGIIAEKG
jgi:hypothetical protein